MISRAFIVGLALLVPVVAKADPCKAIPGRGPMPDFLRRREAFSGPVTYVGDGDSLCVGIGPSPAEWVEVRLSDFYAPETGEPGVAVAKQLLVRLALGHRVVCEPQHRSYDRIVARCEINGRSVGDEMRVGGAPSGGRGARR